MRSTGAEIPHSTGHRQFTLSQDYAPARLVALITAEMPEAFRPADARVLEVVSMAVASTEAAPMAVVDDVR